VSEHNEKENEYEVLKGKQNLRKSGW